MSWQKLDESEPELYYASKAKDVDEIISGLEMVYNRMIERRADDKAENASGLAFLVNATNGYIDMAWYDVKNKKFKGTWKYQLVLNDFSEVSIEHEDGANFFDGECHTAICAFAEDQLYDDDGQEVFKPFVKFETGDFEELMV